MSKLFEASVTYKPFHYPWAVELTKRHEKVHWTEEEAKVDQDVTEWKRGDITEQEKHFITQVLRLFTQSDVNVGTFYYEHLIPRILNNEVRLMLGSNANREGVHQRAYALVVDTLGLPESEYHAFLAYTEMAEKHEHMLEADTSTDEGLMLALAKAICNEGINLFASFAMLLNFQRHGKMKGMGKVVEWSQRDETLHVIGLTHIFRTLAEEKPELITDDLKRQLYDMFRRCVELEDRFVDLSFELGGIKDLTAEQVKRYVRYITNRRMTQLGLKEEWPEIEENPLPWVDWIMSGVDHTNFFEGKVTDYSVAALTGKFEYPPGKGKTLGYVVFTRDGCPHCTDAKQMLLRGLLGFSEVKMNDPEERAHFYRMNGFEGTTGPKGQTMPKVYEMVEGVPRPVLIGGAAELRRHLGLA